MAGHLLLIIGIAVLFYAALPALGAFLARGQWRRFRRPSPLSPTTRRRPRASWDGSAPPPPGTTASSAPWKRSRAMTGSGSPTGGSPWPPTCATCGCTSFPRRRRSEPVPVTPGAGAAALGSVPWSRIFSLPEGTPVFVGGALFSEEGRGVFRDNGRTRLLVVIHDCPRESVVLRAISGGRQRNEIHEHLHPALGGDRLPFPAPARLLPCSRSPSASWPCSP